MDSGGSFSLPINISNSLEDDALDLSFKNQE